LIELPADRADWHPESSPMATVGSISRRNDTLASAYRPMTQATPHLWPIVDRGAESAVGRRKSLIA
jgi:hypothetical protein